MCAKHLGQGHMGKRDSDPFDMKILSLVGQVTLDKSRNFFKLHPSVKRS